MWLLLVVPFCLYVLFDVNYFICFLYTAAKTKLTKALRGHYRNLFDEFTTMGMCTPSDMDFNFHMNNARFIRKTDFCRIDLWYQTGVWEVVCRLGGAVVLGASTARYRRSIALFDRYIVRARILCWDEKSFYVEHKFERCSDNFLCAIIIVKQSFLRVTPAQLVAEVLGEKTESPPFPEEIALWVKSNQVSSEKLRKDL